MTRFLKLIATVFLKFVAVISIVLLMLATVVFFYPQVVLNPTVLSQAEPVAEKYGITWSYDELDMKVDRTSFLGRKLEFGTKDFCVNGDGFDVCVADFSGTLGWRWGYPLDLQQIGPFTAHSPRLQLASKPQAEDAQETDPIALIDQFLTALSDLQLHDIVITDGELKMTDVSNENKITTAVGFAANVETENQKIQRFNIQLKEGKGLPFNTAKAQLNKLSGEDYTIKFEMTGDVNVNVAGKLESLDQRYELSLRSKVSTKDMNVTGVHDLIYSKQTLTIEQAVKVTGLSNAIESLEASNCTTEILNPFAQEATMSISGHCVIDVARSDFVDENVFLITIPKAPKFSAAYRAKVVRHSDRPSTFVASARIDVDPLKTGLYRLEGKLNFDAQGVVSEWQDSDLKSRLESKITIDRFQDVVASLDRSTWAIPAPLNVLDGKIECAVTGDIKTRGSALHAPLDCQTQLSGLRQQVYIAMKGIFELREMADGYQPKIDLTVNMRDVALVLPPIESITSLPRMGPDGRIGVDIDPAKKEKVLPIDFAIKVINEEPIELYSDLTPNPIPFNVSLAIVRGQAIDGTVSSPGFNLALLKQPVEVEFLNVALSTPDEPGSLEGRISITKTDAIIKIDIFGTPEEPGYNIRSIPPMPQSELMAQMMYGSGMDSLDGGSQQSVSEARAAMADGAIGLVSMFYLASTPIESVGYNPHSGSFRAKVRLSNSLALNVGSDFEGQNRFGITRRISNNWSLETYAADSEDGGKAVAMLRWANRY